MIVQAPISLGELIDKMTILEIKKEKIDDAEKLKNINQEYDALSGVAQASIDSDKMRKIEDHRARLRNVNLDLWQTEDEIRVRERDQDFGEAFVALARNVYRQNDARHRLKREIDEMLGSDLVEEKQHTRC